MRESNPMNEHVGQKKKHGVARCGRLPSSNLNSSNRAKHYVFTVEPPHPPLTISGKVMILATLSGTPT